MWKIALGVVLTLLGVIGAGIVTYFSQKRQFNFDRRKQGKIYKNLLGTLVQEIEYIYKKLKEHGSIYSEHYDVSIQNEVINKLLDTELIFKNRDVFGKIRDLIRELLKLNGKIEEYILIVRNPSYWDKKWMQ